MRKLIVEPRNAQKSNVIETLAKKNMETIKKNKPTYIRTTNADLASECCPWASRLLKVKGLKGSDDFVCDGIICFQFDSERNKFIKASGYSWKTYTCNKKIELIGMTRQELLNNDIIMAKQGTNSVFFVKVKED